MRIPTFIKLFASTAITLALLTVTSHATERPTSNVQHVNWSKNATLYEINVRQYSKEGTFAAIEKDLPRIKKLGVSTIWLMPINPIGKENRKGTLGSYYAVSDYTKINPEFGTLEDFKHLVNATHALGMTIIIDWVANHTAWDHPWVKQHPEWYKKDAKGEISALVYDNGTTLEYWTDVVALDYHQTGLWDEMISALRYWVRETNIDGYRCDVADQVPVAFWAKARADLTQIKPMFMLAEGKLPILHRDAFDATYNWALHDVMKNLAKGKLNAVQLREFLAHMDDAYPEDGYKLNFTSNHDINSWDGSDTELFGEGFSAIATLAFTLPGLPLIYDGQESILDKRLEFFEKDAIQWKKYQRTSFYQQLIALKKNNPALWNGKSGGKLDILAVSNPAIFAFKRQIPGNSVTLIFNFTNEPQTVLNPVGRGQLHLKAWDYKIYRNQ